MASQLEIMRSRLKHFPALQPPGIALQYGVGKRDDDVEGFVMPDDDDVQPCDEPPVEPIEILVRVDHDPAGRSGEIPVEYDVERVLSRNESAQSRLQHPLAVGRKYPGADGPVSIPPGRCYVCHDCPP